MKHFSTSKQPRVAAQVLSVRALAAVAAGDNGVIHMEAVPQDAAKNVIGNVR